MNELDTITISNPTARDFTWRFNGQPFTIAANESKSFVRMVGFHLAKHLSSEMIVNDEWDKIPAKKLEEVRNDPKNQIHLKISQLQVYDTHERRIALYKILKDETLVVDLIRSYPFKGFVGEMEQYRLFVDGQRPAAPTKTKESTPQVAVA